MKRRFQIVGTESNVTVVDDYAHHPTEIAATIHAAAEARASFGGRLWVLFQPHRYTRTRDLLGSFAAAFASCDHVVLTDIYSAGESPIPGVTIESLIERFQAAGRHDTMFVRNRGELARLVAPELKPGDMVLTLGAGDITQTGPEILTLLRATPPKKE